jgi:hypothetical protein
MTEQIGIQNISNQKQDRQPGCFPAQQNDTIPAPFGALESLSESSKLVCGLRVRTARAESTQRQKPEGNGENAEKGCE